MGEAVPSRSGSMVLMCSEVSLLIPKGYGQTSLVVPYELLKVFAG